jgi:lysophospholipase L1-like esterase
MKVLVVGDSISIGYTPALQQQLAGLAEVVHSPGNAEDSAKVVSNLGTWLNTAQPDAVVLNCGLHDIKRDRETRAYQVPPDAYRANLTAILKIVDEAGCRLLWVSTTPVIDARHNPARTFDRHDVDADAYNATASAVMEAAGIAVLDLNTAVKELGQESLLGEDGVHFTPDGYNTLGQAVARTVCEHWING